MTTILKRQLECSLVEIICAGSCENCCHEKQKVQVSDTTADAMKNKGWQPKRKITNEFQMKPVKANK